MTGGFSGRILIVDLTRQSVSERTLDRDLAERFIGGLGICIRLADEYIPRESRALDPGNAIILGVGPLVGTSLPSTSRVFAVSRLPSSNTIGWCGAGGVSFGCQLKNSGFDHIVINGRAEKPVLLALVDDTVSILDAGRLWGKGIEETCDTLWEQYPHPAGVLAIGPGGENQVLFSMAFVDRIATLGRGGLGAVLGSKNLKAILVRGSRGVTISDRKSYKKLNSSFMKQIREYPYLKEWQHLGMVKSFPMVPVDTYDKIRKRRIACVSCPVGCKDAVEIPSRSATANPDSPYAADSGTTVVCSSSVVNLWTPVLYGMKDYRDAIHLVRQLDRCGLDTFEFYGVLTFTANLVKAGLLPAADVNPAIDFSSFDAMSAWVDNITLRRGIGDILAGGFKGMLAHFGADAGKHAPSLIKGMHPYTGPGSALPWDLFGTMELGQILDPRGPHVGSGGSPTYFAKRPLSVFYKHFERMGIPPDAMRRIIREDGPDDKRLRVGRLLKYSHSWFSMLVSMGICVRAQINRFYNADLCARLYEAVTGIPTTVADLQQRVGNVWALYQSINRRGEPGTDLDEMPPEQWLQHNGFREYLTGKPLTAATVREMINDYFDEWNNVPPFP